MMKNQLILCMALVSVIAACNSGEDKSSGQQKDSSHVNTGSNQDKMMQSLVDNYLGLKNALAEDNSKQAAEYGKNLEKEVEVMTKSGVAPEQKAVFDDVQDDIRDHAAHISSNADNIAHQREHFEMLSLDLYELLKTGKAGKTLYYTHCPMYNNGAYWLSAEKEIKNPYMGKKMSTCGEIKEEIN